ncbi:MAG: 16S rRNA (cytidine(1402)-2'-O)-methyltransferase [Rickettsiaceae bacterium]|nr:16S rRNA (cytidine(1402)-2'-O)-methyltransferase [Rickettsiaceae bacterium]
MQKGLYIISTPIGNMKDITQRAIETMLASDYIFCEDTRVTRKLLEKHQITAKLSVYNDHSDKRTRDYIASLIDEGAVVSLVSDAGTPLISDPGYKLVRDLQEAGYFVDIAPGVCSITAAITLSGLPSDRFIFNGFMPRTSEAKRKIFNEVAELKATLIFFEAPGRLVSTLEGAFEVFGDREACVVREITKLYQTVKRGSISELKDFFVTNEPRGEIVLLFSGVSVRSCVVDDVEKEVALLLSEGLSTKDVAKILHEKFKSFTKSAIYDIAKKIGKG